MRTLRRRTGILLVTLFLLLVVTAAALLRWGGDLLVSASELPAHADGAIVLQASLPSETARISGAVDLLRRGVVASVLLSIPQEGYWGQSFPEVAHTYLQRRYGRELGDRFQFCVTGPGVDSTEEEAQAVLPCVEEHHWQSLIVVTSNFHSRRARMIWLRVWKRRAPPLRIWVDGVHDPLFEPRGWWRSRRYAKTWFLESTKLVWSFFFR